MASSRGMPSLLALLGLLAVAGFQNRDKLGQILGGNSPAAPGGDSPTAPNGTPAANQQGTGGGFLDDLGKMFGGDADSAQGSSPGGSLRKGLDDLLDGFNKTGQKDVSDSWVAPGAPNKELTASQVEDAIGPDALRQLAEKTGIPYRDLLDRLAAAIPGAVDRLTPDGRLPASDGDLRQRLLSA